MASVQIAHEWSDGETTKVTVAVATSFPDALDEARVTARQAFADAIAEVRTFEASDDRDD
jgi:hypothetical protein